MTKLTDKAAAFLAKRPTLVAIVSGVRFYECPRNGDESPLWAIGTDGELSLTEYWEAPDATDLAA